ncbi:MAG: iron-sulfur cluster assembly scaffold protein [Planctomycetota bacterium]|jgi:hypothetical protein
MAPLDPKNKKHYDATRSLAARPKNWGVIEGADYRVEVTGTGGTAAILTVKLAPDGATVAEARFKSRGVTDCLTLLARAVRTFEGQTLAAMTDWQVKRIADAIGESPVPMSGPPRDALHLALLALRNVLHKAEAAQPGVSGRAAVVADEAENTVCYCMEVSEGTILEAIRKRGCTTRPWRKSQRKPVPSADAEPAAPRSRNSWTARA